MWNILKTNKFINYIANFLPKSSTTTKDFNSDQIIPSLNKSLDSNLIMCKSLPPFDNFENVENDVKPTSSRILNSHENKKIVSLTDKPLNKILEIIQPSSPSKIDFDSKEKINLSRNNLQSKSQHLNLITLKHTDNEIKKDLNQNNSSYILNMFSSSLFVNVFNKVKLAFNYSTPLTTANLDLQLDTVESSIPKSIAVKNNEMLTSNQIKNRVSVIQYAANNPIEDRYNAIQLRNLYGYCLQVLDGHGGSQVADFANKKLHVMFDTKYLELKDNKKISEKDKIITCINFAFKAVVRKFLYNYRKKNILNLR